jgi:hypothetical protein
MSEALGEAVPMYIEHQAELAVVVVALLLVALLVGAGTLLLLP